jgi:hypothetical protein
LAVDVLLDEVGFVSVVLLELLLEVVGLVAVVGLVVVVDVDVVVLVLLVVGVELLVDELVLALWQSLAASSLTVAAP